MALLSASNLSQSFGPVDIFAGISLSIPDGGKIGMVGPNGIGKTTLLLILAGLAQSNSGKIHVAKRTQIGYLPQEAARAFAGTIHSVSDEMLTVFAGIIAQERALRQMEEAMAAGDDSEELFAEYGKKLELFEHKGGYDYQTHIKQTLDGLGFDDENRHLPLNHLSGGQKTRALLARLLLEKPDLLILDEPTNHLDIEAVQWLEGTLKTWEGAVLIVSHDRYFLDTVVNRIWEMNRDMMEVYRGNYSHYVKQRQERWERRQAEFDTFKERMVKELNYIRKHIASQNTLQAKGKLKRVSRELKAVQVGGLSAIQGKSWSQTMSKIEISSSDWKVADAAEAINSLKPPSNRPPKLNFRLAHAQRSGNVVLKTKQLVVGYPTITLFEAEDIELWRGECAALIGGNGAGKTTFLRTTLDKLPPVTGEVILGASLEVGYFAQAHEALHLDQRVLDEFMRHHPMMVSEARNHLARYLFRGDDVYKLVQELSGGERGRLALAILALEGANFLLLDEPTNHLDISAQEVMQEILEKFAGTILLVSHDRYLIDHLATQIWHLYDGKLHVFKGNYRAYLAHQDGMLEVEKEVSASPKQQVRPVQNGTSKLSKNEQRKLDRVLAKLEKDVQEAEERLGVLSVTLQNATIEQRFDKIQSISIEYAEAETELETRMIAWENFLSE